MYHYRKDARAVSRSIPRPKFSSETLLGPDEVRPIGALKVSIQVARQYEIDMMDGIQMKTGLQKLEQNRFSVSRTYPYAAQFSYFEVNEFSVFFLRRSLSHKKNALG
jgi:hypothetical protein